LGDCDCQWQKSGCFAIDPSSAINKGSILGIKPEWKNLQKKKMHLSDLPRVQDFWAE
jgi:putative protein kinase ArgK-like GTPase of G3E family